MTGKVFEAALGIAAPWSVAAVDFDETAKLLTVLIDFKPGSRFAVSGQDGVHPVIVLLQARRLGITFEIPFYLAFYALFLLFVLREGSVRAFGWKPLARIGEASYSLYLLHQYVGVALIAHLWNFVGAGPSNAAVLLAPLVAALLTLLSLEIYRFWEVPAKQKLLDVGRPLLARIRSGSRRGPGD